MKRILLSILFICVLAGPIVTQTRKSGSLKYKLSLVEVDPREKLLIVNAQIVNLSDKKIVVNKNNFTVDKVYKKLGEKLRGGGVTNEEALVVYSHSGLGEKEPEYEILLPGQSANKRFKFKLAGDFFEPAKTFKLLLAYRQFKNASYKNLTVWKGTLESNEIIFKINENE